MWANGVCPQETNKLPVILRNPANDPATQNRVQRGAAHGSALERRNVEASERALPLNWGPRRIVDSLGKGQAMQRNGCSPQGGRGEVQFVRRK